MPNMYAKFESVLSLTMVEQALTDPAVKSVLIEISAQLRRDIFPVIKRAVLAEHGAPTLSPALRSMFGSLAMQHSAGDKFVGALLPNRTQEYLEGTAEGRDLLLTAIDDCLRDADKINTPNQFLSLMKSIDGIAFAYGSDVFRDARTCSDYESIKEYIAPTREEVAIRSLRSGDVEAIPYGIGTEEGCDLVSKKDTTHSCRSGPEGRQRTWFEQLADQSRFNKPRLPLIASPSNAAAKSFIMGHGIGLFTQDNGLFEFDKAQVFANCLMAYLVYCGHHSFLEVMEIWNRQLDFLVIERSNQLPADVIPATPTILPYGKIGDYASFFHPSYAHIVVNIAEAYLSDDNLDLRFIKRIKDVDTSMSKKIVLLDVDNTLLYGGPGQINEALIDALIHAGITQVYFFTMTGLKDIRSYGQSIASCSRYDLVAYMQERGIHVLNVVSVSDRYFHPSAQRAGAFYQDIYTPLMEKRMKTREPLDLKDVSSVDTLDYSFGDLACEIAITLVNRQMQLREGERAEVPRRGLRLIHNVTHEEGVFLSQEEARQFFAIDSHCQQYHLDYRDNLDDMITIVGSSSQNEKGIMLEHFLSIPGIVEKDSTIYFFEDNVEHIAGVAAVVKNYNRTFNTEVKLYTCLMPEAYENATHDIFRVAYAQCLNGRSITDRLMDTQEPSAAEVSVESSLLNRSVFPLKFFATPSNTTEVLPLGSERPYVDFDLELTDEEKALFQRFDLSLVNELPPELTQFSYFGGIASYEEQLANYLRQLGQNGLNDIATVAKIMTRLSQHVLEHFERDCGWFALRPTLPNEAFKIPRWHRDGYFYSPHQDPQAKAVMALKGPRTLFFEASPAQRAAMDEFDNNAPPLTPRMTKINDFIQYQETVRIQLDKRVFDRSQAVTAHYGRGTLFTVGAHGAVHSEPDINEPRLFFSVLPGTPEQIAELQVRWSRKNPPKEQEMDTKLAI